MFSFVCERRHLWETGPSNRVKDQRRSISWAPWAWAESLLNKCTVKMERKNCAWPKIKWCFSLDLGFRYLFWNSKDCDVQQYQTFVPSNENDSVNAQLWIVEKSSFLVLSYYFHFFLFFFKTLPISCWKWEWLPYRLMQNVLRRGASDSRMVLDGGNDRTEFR